MVRIGEQEKEFAWPDQPELSTGDFLDHLWIFPEPMGLISKLGVLLLDSNDFSGQLLVPVACFHRVE